VEVASPSFGEIGTLVKTHDVLLASYAAHVEASGWSTCGVRVACLDMHPLRLSELVVLLTVSTEMGQWHF
jgi:hypothetical protein